jgi:hypothetical protein
MEQDPSEQVLQVEDLALAVKGKRPNPEDLSPHKTILETWDAGAALAGVVDKGEEFPSQVILVTIQATINLNTSHAKGITRIRAKKYSLKAFPISYAG